MPRPRISILTMAAVSPVQPSTRPPWLSSLRIRPIRPSFNARSAARLRATCRPASTLLFQSYRLSDPARTMVSPCRRVQLQAACPIRDRRRRIRCHIQASSRLSALLSASIPRPHIRQLLHLTSTYNIPDPPTRVHRQFLKNLTPRLLSVYTPRRPVLSPQPFLSEGSSRTMGAAFTHPKAETSHPVSHFPHICRCNSRSLLP